MNMNNERLVMTIAPSGRSGFSNCASFIEDVRRVGLRAP